MIDVDSSTFLACAIIRCDTARKRLILNGEMSEWLKEHAWKACVGETLPWVRIPLSPPSIQRIRQPERCQSGRMGRSRKPLTGQPVRGFESHPLRHSLFTSAAKGWTSLTYSPAVQYFT